MDIRQLSYFITVADMQNYSHAAKCLYVSQPALKQSIKKMENELHSQLFVYSNQRLHLTEAGKILYERGKTIVEEFDQLMADVRDHDTVTKSKLTLGVTFLTMLQYMDKISRFIRQNPDVDLHIIQDGSMKLQHLLSEKKIDVGILSYPQVVQDIIIDTFETNEKSSSYTACVVVPEDKPLASKGFVSFKDLVDQNIVSLSANFALGEFTKKRCIEYGFLNQVIMTHDDFEILLHSLHKLNAITILPKELETYSPVSNLVWIPLKDSQINYQQGVAFRKVSSSNAPIVRRFIDAIKN